MAENPYRSYRGRDQVPHGDDAGPLSAPADPLAELARLIGQNDPRYQPGHDHAAQPGAAPSEEWPSEQPYEESDQVVDAAYDENYDERYDPPRLAEPATPYAAVPPSRHRDYPPPAPPRAHGAGAEARFYAPAEPRHPAGQQAPAGYGQPLPAFAAHHDDYDYDDQEQDVSAYAEDDDTAGGGRRRGGLVIVAAVLGVAVLGTAGAFAYRAMFGGSMMLSLPPIIKADTSPNKIMPNAGQGGSSAQANAGMGTSGDKVVSREEQPLNVPAPVSTAPRVVSTIPIFPAPATSAGAWANGVTGAAAALPPASSAPESTASASMVAPMASPMPAAPAQSMSPPVAAPMTQAPTAMSTEPKKIHTVAIRPDQPGVATPVAPAAAPGAPAASAPRPVAAAKPVMAAPARPAAASADNGPLSIVPGQADAAAPVPVRTRTASLVQSPLPGAATGTAPAVSAAGGGGYAVQITSQRSEADAQTAFRSLAAKYPTQLGGHQPIIRQADLGTKGIYYRALVGPFASMEQAAALCSSLKAAGGSCLVQRN